MSRSKAAAPGGRTPLMAGNWKMHLDHVGAAHLVQKLDWTLKDAKHDFGAVEVVVLPPFTDLRTVQTLVDGDRLDIRYGAQDLSPHDEGAHTGDVSGLMLARLGCTYVVVGHSERREHHGESDEVVGSKVQAALRHGLTPIVCVGEPLEVRHAGGAVEHVLAQARRGPGVGDRRPGRHARRRLRAALGHRHRRDRDGRRRAGGLRRVAHPPGGAVQRRGRRRRPRALRRLGEGRERRRLMAEPDVDGALVGGASLQAGEFASICRYHSHRTGATAGAAPAASGS
ncbi:hypothetical protein GCM10025868_02600 [Angustibacter aerolatus]|uniref:Triosephosphate isomerase n=1 Tax=Angustibacter aerolatus TaxID=1162965 RepID=A0ABQ6JCT0_9ACTN|nr:hypothetical protein GCM10025868_02600 [Angustibacter aerolatus]